MKATLPDSFQEAAVPAEDAVRNLKGTSMSQGGRTTRSAGWSTCTMKNILQTDCVVARLVRRLNHLNVQMRLFDGECCPFSHESFGGYFAHVLIEDQNVSVAFLVL